MKSKILILSLFLIGIVSLQAQEEEDKHVSVSIDFVSWGEDLSGLEVITGKRSTPVKALAFRYSESLDYKGPQIFGLVFGKDTSEATKEDNTQQPKDKAGDADEPAEPANPVEVPVEVKGAIPKDLTLARVRNPSLAALVKLPANTRRVTILLAPGPQNSLVPYIFDDDPARHPMGIVRVHNLSLYPVAVRTASGKATELQPRMNFLSKVPDGIFVFELAYQNEGEWKIQENNMINVGPKDQVHMVILRDKSSFFTSDDGSRGGFMQIAYLRRTIRE